MFCLYTLSLVRPAQVKIQMLTAFFCIVKLVPWNEVNLSHLYGILWKCLWLKRFQPIVFHIFFPIFAIGRICTHYLSSRPKPTSKKKYLPHIKLNDSCLAFRCTLFAKRKHLFFFQFAMHCSQSFKPVGFSVFERYPF